MGQQLDFMNQPIEQLREIIQDYDVFCRTAEKLEWINIKEQYKIYQLNYTVMDFGVYEFPSGLWMYMHEQFYLVWHIMRDGIQNFGTFHEKKENIALQ